MNARHPVGQTTIDPPEMVPVDDAFTMLTRIKALGRPIGFA